MSSILHITNGDSTTQLLKSQKIKGEIITWREMLCEGKTTTDVGSEDFWKTRFDFLNTSYKVTKKTFIDLTLKEYRNLCKQNQDEIVLWFDYDLFCQVNLIAVVSWLKRYRKGRKITLVQSGKTDESEKLVGFSELSSKGLKNLYSNRATLTKDDIEYADYIWQLYCSDSPLRLETVHKFNPSSPFIYLPDAIKAHLLRFPSIENGLNAVENEIIETVASKTFDSKNELIRELLNNQTVYGFGDVQYANKLNELKKLFTSFSPTKLSKKGKQVLEKQFNYYREIRSDFSYLGGAKKYSYLYVNTNDKLLKLTS
ncbi:DUF1835 domain-containing protein [Tenacibaculum sp. M341]|uniref:DUF1835 domain-containing protein n=1 Tax=Tenacibaculum sp. M341 TaxID=2530339 RepID=UPI0010431571|nr:DUF1835 domain-containing protein [Tenacibaculum sp. M341]TCI92763.1 DUF1835 domain-containing protein [Tenacibaculum sp. M341]